MQATTYNPHKKQFDVSGFNEFKKSEKQYRSYPNRKQNDLIGLLDFSAMSEDELKGHEITVEEIPDIRFNGNGDGVKTLKCYKFDWPQGLMIIKDYVKPIRQLEICREAMNEWVNKPHRTNLFIYEDSYQAEDKPKNEKDILKKIVNDDNRFFFHCAIRWANIGKQYDWPNRCYFNPDAIMIPTIYNLGVDGVNQFELQDYNPEACICNFYDKKDHMGGHLDDGEPDQLHPIISYSFGLSCVFLIGGKTKQQKPHAIRLEGGDIIIMSTESRLSYHGVPRVIENTFDRKRFENELDNVYPNWREEPTEFDVKNDFGLSKNNFKHVLNYLETSRINVNIRQVFLKGEEEQLEKEKLEQEIDITEIKNINNMEPPAEKKIKSDDE